MANFKLCKAITSLLFSGDSVWSKSGFKGLFSKLKRINIHSQYTTGQKRLNTLENQEPQNNNNKAVYKHGLFFAFLRKAALPHSKNWKLKTGKSQTSVSSRQFGTQKKQALTGKISFEWSSNLVFQVGGSGLFLELRPEDH